MLQCLALLAALAIFPLPSGACAVRSTTHVLEDDGARPCREQSPPHAEPWAVVAIEAGVVASRLTVTVRNLSDQVLHLSAMKLSVCAMSSSFWSPVGLRSGAFLTLASNNDDGRVRVVRIDPKSETSLVIDDPIARPWGRTIGARWPEQRLQDLLPTGRYTMTVEVKVWIGSRSRTLASNPVPIDVGRGQG